MFKQINSSFSAKMSTVSVILASVIVCLFCSLTSFNVKICCFLLRFVQFLAGLSVLTTASAWQLIKRVNIFVFAQHRAMLTYYPEFAN